MRADGLPAHRAQWRWTANVPGKPGGASGSGDDLDECKDAFKAAWADIRAGLTEDDMTPGATDASREVLALYQRRRPV
jgi:hypothetical protein